MKTITADKITQTVKNMCIEANCNLPEDIRCALEGAKRCESFPPAREMLSTITENADIAKKNCIPVCQDTGFAVFFVEIGSKVQITGNISKAIEEGVSLGYTEGYLRASVVSDPLIRKNTGDNTPPVIHNSFNDSDNVTITFAPKGFGSENMSAVKMLTPSDGREGVIDFVLDTVRRAGSNPCPPIVVGVGIGGTMEMAAILSKKALTKNIDGQNDNPFYAEMEEELLAKINALGIGVQGFSGDTTALGVNILTYPTHIAGLPVAVNISCHVTRHMTVVL